MALRNAIGSCARLQLRGSGGPALGRSLASRSCEGSVPPPCPPCPAVAPPPCRGRGQERARARRVVCCPPPQGHPPPCAPPCANPPLTCAEAVPEGSAARGRAATCKRKTECGVELDIVAQRLERAELERRRSYEEEAARRRACRHAFPPLTPYSLGAARDCCTATDGKNYATCNDPPPEKCGPNRTPPPPRCVTLVKDSECQVRGAGHVDQCAHEPRTFLRIDRSGCGNAPRELPVEGKRPPSAENRIRRCDDRSDSDRPASDRPASAPTPPPRKFTARLMESLNLTRNAESTKSCPRRGCDGACDGAAGARRAGDTAWCQNLKPPPAVAPPCRPPTSAELLKRRPPSRCPPNDPRCFHTAAALPATTKKPPTTEKSAIAKKSAPTIDQIKADTAKLEKALEERESYGEAGRGRVATGEISVSKAGRPTASLDICVPPGSEKLSVQVMIDDGGCKKKPQCKKPPRRAPEEPCKGPAAPPVTPRPPAASERAPPPVVCCSGATGGGGGSSGSGGGSGGGGEKRESWLSIKSLLASCRKDSGHTPTCPTNAPKPPPPPPAGPSPCKPPAAPSSPCKPLSSPSPCKPPASPSPCKPPAGPSSPCEPPSSPSPCKPCIPPASPRPCNHPTSPPPCNRPASPPPPSPCQKPLLSPNPCAPPRAPSRKADKPKDPCSQNKTKKFVADNDMLLDFLK